MFVKSNFFTFSHLLRSCIYKSLQVFNNSSCVIMDKKYVIQCPVSGCITKRNRKVSVSIHRFPKRRDAGQR